MANLANNRRDLHPPFSKWNSKRKLYIGFVLLMIGLGILYYLIDRIGLSVIGESLARAKLVYLLCGILTALFSLCVRAYKWHIALSVSVNTRFRYFSTLLIYFSNFMLSYFTPLKSGELLAPFFFRRLTQLKYSKGFSIIVVDRFLELVTMLALVVGACLYLLSAGIGRADLNLQLGILLILLIGLIFLLIIASLHKYGGKIVAFVRKRRQLEWLYPVLEAFYLNLQLLKKRIPVLMLVTILAWLIDALTFYFIFNSIIDISYFKSAAIEFISTCAGVLTFIPGGIGVSELSTVWLLEKMGFSPVPATTAGILIRLPVLLVIISALGGIFHNIFITNKTGTIEN